MDTQPGYVATPCGQLPGCAECKVVAFPGQVHICEHGVTVTPPVEISITVELSDPATLLALVYGVA